MQKSIERKCRTMNKAIKHHFGKRIKKRIKLPNGWKETWLLILSDGQKIVFRTHAIRPNIEKTVILSNNKIMADIYNREKFFYESVNASLGTPICPRVLVVDGTGEYYENAFQISEFIEGKSLSECLKNDFDEQAKQDIYFKIGALTARINQVEIDPGHEYVAGRGSWEAHFADKLRGKLDMLVTNAFITAQEIEQICNNVRNMQATHTRSFMHLDIRPHNMIYRNGDLFLFDAEECEFGDPLYELACIDMEWNYWEMHDELLKGYQSVASIDLRSGLYLYYKLERLAMVLDMHFNRGCMNSFSQFYLNMFQEMKESMLSH